MALVNSGARMRDIVAITFTEAAAAELSERVRSRLEQLLDQNNPQNDQDIKHLERAVSELDEASVQTIHSFAAQLLRERPLDAGLPPGWMTLDEIADSERFNERWDGWLETVLARDADISPDLAASLRYLAETEGDLGKWKTVAEAICEDLHRFPDGDEIVESGLGTVVETTLEELNELAGECSNPSDRLYEQLLGAIETVEAVGEAADDPVAAKKALDDGELVDYNRNVGAKGNWGMDPRDVRQEFRTAGRAFQSVVRFAPSRSAADEVGRFARASESARRSMARRTSGTCWCGARNVLRTTPPRGPISSGATPHLIDEFRILTPFRPR